MSKFPLYSAANSTPIYHFYKPSIATETLPITEATGAASAAVAVVGGWGCLIQCTQDAGIKQGTAASVSISDIDEDGVIRLMAGAWYPLILNKTTTHIAHKRDSADGKLNIIYIQQIEDLV
jgi:hypothetical protein